METQGRTTPVRLIGVDTPETVAPDQPIGCYGKEASRYTKEVLEDRLVRLEIPRVGDSEDAYGRTLAYVFIDTDKDGSYEHLFNEDLIILGLARTTTFSHANRREFERLREEAEERGAGLWGACPEVAAAPQTWHASVPVEEEAGGGGGRIAVGRETPGGEPEGKGERRMDLMDRMDAELVAAYQEVPVEGLIDWDDLPAAREFLAQMFDELTADIPDSENVTKDDREAPGPEGAPVVPIRVYRPTGSSGTLPGVLWIHGGGYVVGSVDQDDLVAQHVCEAVDCVVVSVEYRLAPEHPFPAPLEDCYATLKWMVDNATELGMDPDRIAITGPSAGGGLTAGLALLARDRGEVSVAFQAPIYPMIDDRNDTPSSHTSASSRIWSRTYNENGWRAYVGEAAGTEAVSPYAAVTRATDLSGLPPAYIAVGTLDVFLDEDIEYARRLIEAGVPTELHIYPGLFHGSDIFVPDAASSGRFVTDRDAALRRALHPEPAALPG